MIGDDPVLLEQSYRLRYQVYCVERHFLNADDYPDGREMDDFDAVSVHVGALDSDGELAGTARVVLPTPLGYPLSHYCAFFPEVRLDAPGMRVVECSRTMISRDYVPRSRTEPFLTIMRGVIQQAKVAGATHMIAATESGLLRLLVRHGMPWRVAGPATDYFGAGVSPTIMSLAELDQATLSGRYRSLDRFPVGWAPNRWPDFHEPAGMGAALAGVAQ